MTNNITSPAGFNWDIYTDNAPDFNKSYDRAANGIKFVDETAPKYVAEAQKHGWVLRQAEHRVLHLNQAAFRAVFVRVSPDGKQEALRIGIDCHYNTTDGYRVFLEYNNRKYYTQFANESYNIEQPEMAFFMLACRLSRC